MSINRPASRLPSAKKFAAKPDACCLQSFAHAGLTQHSLCKRWSAEPVQGLQTPGVLEGFRHRGPRFTALGTLIIALGPALCSPLNGVVPVKPQAVASAELLNQIPT